MVGKRKGKARIIPTLRYRNARPAIDWLCAAFGFREHLVAAGEDGTIHHAQLTLNGGMIMLGSVRDDAFGALQKTPEQIGGGVTQSAYIVIEDADAHHAQAVSHGARVVYPLTDEEYGGRGYSCLDPEGHLWNFGTYDPC